MAWVQWFLVVLKLAVPGSWLNGTAPDGFRRQSPEVHCFFTWPDFFLYCFEALDFMLVLILELKEWSMKSESYRVHRKVMANTILPSLCVWIPSLVRIRFEPGVNVLELKLVPRGFLQGLVDEHRIGRLTVTLLVIVTSGWTGRETVCRLNRHSWARSTERSRRLVGGAIRKWRWWGVWRWMKRLHLSIVVWLVFEDKGGLQKWPIWVTLCSLGAQHLWGCASHSGVYMRAIAISVCV